MRPRNVSMTSYEPPRWRNRRNRDLRNFALMYAVLLVTNVALVIAVATHPHWLAAEHSALVTYLRIFAVAAYYIASGGLLVAYVTHQIALWQAQRIITVRPPAWLMLLLWPFVMATLLLRLVNPIGGR